MHDTILIFFTQEPLEDINAPLHLFGTPIHRIKLMTFNPYNACRRERNLIIMNTFGEGTHDIFVDGNQYNLNITIVLTHTTHFVVYVYYI